MTAQQICVVPDRQWNKFHLESRITFKLAKNGNYVTM